MSGDLRGSRCHRQVVETAAPWHLVRSVERMGGLQGDVWTALVPALPKKGVLYAYRVDGPGGWETGYRCSSRWICCAKWL